MRRILLPLATLTGVAVVLAGCQVLSPTEELAGIDVAPQVDVVLDLSAASQEVAIDSATNTIWLATVQPVEKDTLWAVDMGSGETRAFDLPDVDYNGYTTHVRVGQDRAVWVSLPYELARWDPTSGEVTSLRFTEEVDGALPDALDPDATLPGTWLSGILPDGTGVLVARNHVPYLTRVSADMMASRGAEVGEDYAGAADLVRGSDGSILMLPALDNPAAAVEVLGGPEIAGTEDLGPRRLLVDGPVVSALSLDDSTTVVASTGSQPGARGLWTRMNSAGATVQYDPAAGAFVRHESDGSTDLLQLEQFQGETSGGGIDPDTGKQTNASTSVTTWDRVTDFVIADDGTVWLLRHNGTQLVRWDR